MFILYRKRNSEALSFPFSSVLILLLVSLFGKVLMSQMFWGRKTISNLLKENDGNVMFFSNHKQDLKQEASVLNG